MKNKILKHILSLSTVACLVGSITTIVSCSEPKVGKSMVIKTKEGNNLESMQIGDVVELAAFDSTGKVIPDISFQINTSDDSADYIEIEGSILTAKAKGRATIIATDIKNIYKSTTSTINIINRQMVLMELWGGDSNYPVNFPEKISTGESLVVACYDSVTQKPIPNVTITSLVPARATVSGNTIIADSTNTGEAQILCSMTGYDEIVVSFYVQAPKEFEIKYYDGRPLPDTISVGSTIDLGAYYNGDIDNTAVFSVVFGQERVSLQGSQNTLTAIKAGPVTIKAHLEAEGGIDAIWNVIISKGQMYAMQEGYTSLPTNMEIGESVNLVTVGVTTSLPLSNVTYSTSSTNVISIEGNKITAVGVGDATITCSHEDYNDFTFNVNVTKKTMTLKTSSGELLPSSLIINETLEITAYDKQGTAVTGITLTPDSGSEAFVTISGNVITGIAKGSASITCSKDGFVSNTFTLSIVDTSETSFITAPTDLTYRQEKTWQYGSTAADKRKIGTVFTGFKFTPLSTWTSHTEWTASDLSVVPIVKDQSGTTFDAGWQTKIINFVNQGSNVYTFSIALEGNSANDYTQLSVTFDITAKVSTSEQYTKTVGALPTDALTIDKVDCPQLVLSNHGYVQMPRILHQVSGDTAAAELPTFATSPSGYIVGCAVYAGFGIDPNSQILIYVDAIKYWYPGPLWGGIWDTTSQLTLEVINCYYENYVFYQNPSEAGLATFEMNII